MTPWDWLALFFVALGVVALALDVRDARRLPLDSEEETR